MNRMMDKQKRVAEAIKAVITSMMDKVMDKVLLKDPFIKEDHRSRKPLYAALVPDEIFKGSHFERRFVTPFGTAWENLAMAVAVEEHGACLRNHSISGNVTAERLRRIQEVLNRLEHSSKGKKREKPDWDAEIKYILKGDGELIPVTVTCDIFICNKETGQNLAFELKGPLPNSDQTKVSKEKMFKLLAMEPCHVTAAYYALPYNPYGKKEDYAWSFPQRWFNMHQDKSVLIGSEFWDMIGGQGTYENFIEEVNLLGNEYKERIYREFLEIEPPEALPKNLLK